MSERSQAIAMIAWEYFVTRTALAVAWGKADMVGPNGVNQCLKDLESIRVRCAALGVSAPAVLHPRVQ